MIYDKFAICIVLPVNIWHYVYIVASIGKFIVRFA